MTDQPVQNPPRASQIRSLSGTRPSADESGVWTPPIIETIADTGLNLLYVSDLVLKVLYYGGVMAGHVIADVVKLPYTGVLDTVMEFLKREKYIEVRGATGFNESAYQYVITLKGAEKARDAMERSQYAGPAPVPLRQYIESVHGQNVRKLVVHQEDLRRIMTNMVISDELLSQIGPAVNSGRSIFLYGPPGNGKTTISEKIGRMILGDDIWIPYAIDVDGQIVQVFDSVNHELSEQETRVKSGTGKVRDMRWIRIKRPMIMVGGELTMAGLDLVWNDVNKFYEAPYQVKANGGMFLIDDFGRQQVRPKDLLNRWIVPLEKGVDFLTLNNGRKIEVPFFVLIVFSTNLDPKDLVDEAFLRRIRYKIEVGNPTYEQYREVFKVMCRLLKVPYDEQGLAYLLNEWYIKQDRDLRFVHPRDLLSQIIDIATYLNKPPMLTKDLIDRACASYFVEL
ncbi:MAG: ATP-binding protein [Aggregatilineales bacterium]